jgi:hypothetical protein
MDTNKVISELVQERDRIDVAIAALRTIGSTKPRRGRPPKSSLTFDSVAKSLPAVVTSPSRKKAKKKAKAKKVSTKK